MAGEKLGVLIMIDGVLVYPDVSENCGYMGHLPGDEVLYITLMILLTQKYAWVYWLIHKLRSWMGGKKGQKPQIHQRKKN